MGHTSPRVLFVSPRFNPNSFWSFAGTCELQGAKCTAPPLGLITIAAMLPQHWQLKLIDRNAEDLHDGDIAGASQQAAEAAYLGALLLFPPPAG